jgi:hypothetical protein
VREVGMGEDASVSSPGDSAKNRFGRASARSVPRRQSSKLLAVVVLDFSAAVCLGIR